MIHYQRSLFGDDEEEGVITKKTIKLRRPMAENRVVIPPSNNQKDRKISPNVEGVGDIPYKMEVERLLEATVKRSFLPEYSDHERKRISDHLIGVSKKSARNMEIIIDLAVLILKERTNLYPTQAVDFASEGDTFGLLQNVIKKTIKIRR